VNPFVNMKFIGVLAVAEDDIEKINLEQFNAVEKRLEPETPSLKT
jgi:hypothetical protein